MVEIWIIYILFNYGDDGLIINTHNPIVWFFNLYSIQYWPLETNALLIKLSEIKNEAAIYLDSFD